MNKDDILHLASLARLELTEKEIESFPKQFDDILTFVDQVKQYDVPDEVIRDMQNYNSFRADDVTHTAGESRDEIMAGMPQVTDDQLQVKKVLSN